MDIIPLWESLEKFVLHHWSVVAVIFEECELTTKDYVIWVASVATGANGVSSISESIKKIMQGSDQRAHDVFLACTLEFISKLSKENKLCEDGFKDVGEQPAKNLKREQLVGIAKSKNTIESNEKTLQQVATVLAREAVSSRVRDFKAFDGVGVLSFMFAVLSVFVLVFSPGIANIKLHYFWFLFLFLPQIVLFLLLVNALKDKFFPPRYIKLVSDTRRGLVQKLLAVLYFEISIFKYRPGSESQMSTGVEVTPSDDNHS